MSAIEEKIEELERQKEYELFKKYTLFTCEIRIDKCYMEFAPSTFSWGIGRISHALDYLLQTTPKKDSTYEINIRKLISAYKILKEKDDKRELCHNS